MRKIVTPDEAVGFGPTRIIQIFLFQTSVSHEGDARTTLHPDFPFSA